MVLKLQFSGGMKMRSKASILTSIVEQLSSKIYRVVEAVLKPTLVQLKRVHSMRYPFTLGHWAPMVDLESMLMDKLSVFVVKQSLDCMQQVTRLWA
ncbi:hypothetical protein D3C81_1159650 [compost metagenome]